MVAMWSMLTLSRQIFSPHPWSAKGNDFRKRLVLFVGSRCSGGCIVASHEVVPSDRAHFEEYFQRSGQRVEFRTLDVTPANGRFEESPALFLRYVKDLRIEPKAINSLQTERGMSCFSSESLEAALRVCEAEADESLEDEVPAAADGFAETRLTFFDATAGKRARAEDYVVAILFDGRDDLLSFFRGSAHVGIAEEDDLAIGVEDAIADGESSAAVARVVDESEAIAGALGEGEHDCGRLIGRAIINDEDLAGIGLLVEVIEGLTKRPLNPAFFVVCRDNDR